LADTGTRPGSAVLLHESLRRPGILVVASRVAAPAAIKALTESRAGKHIDHARGKGTMSLPDAG
jgi:hypothetical protein